MKARCGGHILRRAGAYQSILRRSDADLSLASRYSQVLVRYVRLHPQQPTGRIATVVGTTFTNPLPSRKLEPSSSAHYRCARPPPDRTSRDVCQLDECNRGLQHSGSNSAHPCVCARSHTQKHTHTNTHFQRLGKSNPLLDIRHSETCCIKI
jgi:hypothetical protein